MARSYELRGSAIALFSRWIMIGGQTIRSRRRSPDHAEEDQPAPPTNRWSREQAEDDAASSAAGHIGKRWDAAEQQAAEADLRRSGERRSAAPDPDRAEVARSRPARGADDLRIDDQEGEVGLDADDPLDGLADLETVETEPPVMARKAPP
jgi:hypothetical protein